MSLTEPQIARYSRQILLKAVGGRGQERLLQAAVHVVGDGLTASTAAAYLAAGGSPVAPPFTLSVARKGEVEGPLGHGEQCENGPSTSPLRATLRVNGGFPVELTPNAQPVGTVASAPFSDWPPGARALIGAEGVVFMTADGCANCFEATAANLTPAPNSVEQGALGALVWQSLILGHTDSLGASGLDLHHCGGHR